MQNRQEKIIEIATRNARGDLTPTQLDWWCSHLNTNLEEMNEIYGSKLLQGLGRTIKVMVLWFLLLSFLVVFLRVL
jgi:hypothetical protein